MTTTKPFQLGSISTGTHQPEDLLRAFTATLHRLEAPSILQNQDWSELLNDAVNMVDGKTDWDDYMLDELLPNALNELCPPFVYFGAHPGDGADFGFWPDWDALADLIKTHSDFSAGHSWTLPEQHCRMHFDGDQEIATCLDLQDNVIWTSGK